VFPSQVAFLLIFRIIQNIGFLARSCVSLKDFFPWFDACRLAHGRDALIPGGPCVSPSIRLRTGSASGPALLRPASLPSHEARRGVSGFGAFCRNKRPVLSQVEGASPAGAKPGHTEQHVDTRVGDTRARRASVSACLPVTPKKNFRYPTSSCQARTIHSE